jgi:xanthine dehydrogenase YagS FAD-binding subunit
VRPFTYVKPADADHAVKIGSGSHPALDTAQYIAGGTTLIDLMRLDVMRPTTVIDITGLPHTAVEQAGKSVMIGALVRNSDLVIHPLIVKGYPVLAEALLSGASEQLRNLATTGGNLLQRTRCPYFRDVQTACNKRTPGSGCSAIGGFTRSHAVLGGSAQCIATNPSDMNVALVALDAIVHTTSATGTRTIPIADFHTLPGDHPEIESVLGPGELITQVELPPSAVAARSHYLKVRDRASFAFALASAAVAVDLAGGTIREARIALGGVATKPWRAREAEAILAGQKPSVDVFRRAADAALAGAKAQVYNQFKIELAKRTIVRALSEVTA